MTNPVDVEGVSKRYVKYDDTPLLATSAMRWRNRTRRSELWALRDVDLSVAPGECLGVIGHNGSGKSTLMRLLAGVSAPTQGRVRVRGRVAPLISVGVGFHPELSGRENVFLNGIILGLRRSEIEQRLDEIVAFAEVEEFIDTPVKFYSSGMYLRLGFAVAVSADPEVMIVDEVLSVGDIAFQLKCMERMAEIKTAGAALVLVSHNLAAVRRTCDRVIVLHEGRLRFDGDPDGGIALLHELIDAHTQAVDDTGLARIGNCDLVDAQGDRIRSVPRGQPITAEIDFRTLVAVEEIWVGVLVNDEGGVYAFGENRHIVAPFAADTSARLSVTLQTPLATGTYSIRIVLSTPDGSHLTWMPSQLDFFVEGRSEVEGIADLAADFTIEAQRLG